MRFIGIEKKQKNPINAHGRLSCGAALLCAALALTGCAHISAPHFQGAKTTYVTDQLSIIKVYPQVLGIGTHPQRETHCDVYGSYMGLYGEQKFHRIDILALNNQSTDAKTVDLSFVLQAYIDLYTPSAQTGGQVDVINPLGVGLYKVVYNPGVFTSDFTGYAAIRRGDYIFILQTPTGWGEESEFNRYLNKMSQSVVLKSPHSPFINLQTATHTDIQTWLQHNQCL